eukprot:jgi/Bigna1/140152/aug1.54_g14860
MAMAAAVLLLLLGRLEVFAYSNRIKDASRNQLAARSAANSSLRLGPNALCSSTPPDTATLNNWKKNMVVFAGGSKTKNRAIHFYVDRWPRFKLWKDKAKSEEDYRIEKKNGYLVENHNLEFFEVDPKFNDNYKVKAKKNKYKFTAYVEFDVDLESTKRQQNHKVNEEVEMTIEVGGPILAEFNECVTWMNERGWDDNRNTHEVVAPKAGKMAGRPLPQLPPDQVSPSSSSSSSSSSSPTRAGKTDGRPLPELPPRVQALPLPPSNIKLILFDFDKTATQEHTRGNWKSDYEVLAAKCTPEDDDKLLLIPQNNGLAAIYYLPCLKIPMIRTLLQGKLSAFSWRMMFLTESKSHILEIYSYDQSSTFTKVVPKLIKSGFSVGIATYSDDKLYETAPWLRQAKIGAGKEFIRGILELVFTTGDNPALTKAETDKIMIYGLNPSYHNILSVPEEDRKQCFKTEHINNLKAAWEHEHGTNLRSRSIVLFDDDKENCAEAVHKSDIYAFPACTKLSEGSNKCKSGLTDMEWINAMADLNGGKVPTVPDYNDDQYIKKWKCWQEAEE